MSEQTKRIRFKFCNRAVPHETQTTFLPEKREENSLIDKLRISDTKTIIENEVRPLNNLTMSMMRGFNARLGFFVTAAYDKRFDPLMPPNDLYKGLKVGFEVFLRNYNFSISPKENLHESAFTSAYHAPFVKFIECLETGLVNKELLKLLNKWNINLYSNGFMICKCHDNREPTEVVSYLKLEIANECFISHALDPLNGLEFERKMVLKKRPLICTDPSPDVARINSIMDFRKKMWYCQRQRYKEDFTPVVEPVKLEQPVKSTHFQTLRSKISLPDDIIKSIYSSNG